MSEDYVICLRLKRPPFSAYDLFPTYNYCEGYSTYYLLRPPPLIITPYPRLVRKSKSLFCALDH